MTEIGESAFVSTDKKNTAGNLKVMVVNICNDQPIEGAKVSAGGVTKKTNTSGEVVFNNVHPGSVNVLAKMAWPELDYFNFITHYPAITSSKKAKSHDIQDGSVSPGGTIAITIKIPVFRKVDKVIFKRKHIDFFGSDQFGHWWTEIDDTESYGWWPKNPVGYREDSSQPPTLPPPLSADPSIMQRIQHTADMAYYHAAMAWFETEPTRNQVSDTFEGVEGELNGQSSFGGTPTVDPHHGDAGDNAYQPTINDCRNDSIIKQCIRRTARSYSGSWAWRFESGKNCHSFQIDIINHCDIKNMIEF